MVTNMLSLEAGKFHEFTKCFGTSFGIKIARMLSESRNRTIMEIESIKGSNQGV